MHKNEAASTMSGDGGDTNSGYNHDMVAWGSDNEGVSSRYYTSSIFSPSVYDTFSGDAGDNAPGAHYDSARPSADGEEGVSTRY